MLVLHYQVHGEERFPKLFSYEKLFVRFAKYQNAKRAHCTKSESTKVPKFCTDIRLFKCDCMSKKKFENIVSIQSYMYDFVIKFEKVCLGLIAPKFEVPARLAFGGYMLVLHYQVHGEERFPKLFSYEKLFVRFAKYQNAKRAHCTKSESTKVPKFCTDIRLFKCDCMSKKKIENIVSIQSYM